MPIKKSHTASSDFNTTADLRVASTLPVHQASKIDKGIHDVNILAGHRHVCAAMAWFTALLDLCF